MSTAVIFLLLALAMAGAGSLLVWVIHRFPKRPEPGYWEQLEAIAPVNGRPADPPSGIAALVPLTDEEH